MKEALTNVHTFVYTGVVLFLLYDSYFDSHPRKVETTEYTQSGNRHFLAYIPS